MTNHSEFDRLSASRQNGKLIFDPTINAGHVLTFLGFMISGFVAYSTLDKRVTVIEQRAGTIEERADEQDARIKDSLGEIKQDLREVKGAIKEMADRSVKQQKAAP
jgi:flagellar capping protein FliD